MKHRYFRDWSRSQKTGLNEITEDSARGMHERGDLYVVLLGEAHPSCALEIKSDFIAAEFLDDQRRSYVSYQFQKKTPEKLFLSLAVYRRFVGDTDEVESGSSFSFQVDGTVAINERNYVSGDSTRVEKKTDVSRNWENPPTFGD